jgi:putative cardiolipin synthase
LAECLFRAADRGVRVRVLLDDMNFKGRDAVLAALDAHPNIEIRIFNPFAHRGARAIEFLANFKRINHRMHNKLVVMDNALAIVGGRNIGDHYFQILNDGSWDIPATIQPRKIVGAPTPCRCRRLDKPGPRA